MQQKGSVTKDIRTNEIEESVIHDFLGTQIAFVENKFWVLRDEEQGIIIKTRNYVKLMERMMMMCLMNLKGQKWR
tara:strand:- start:637 stop:861 length:225 start_codon:yes stop_codon:yes gene_type:complete